jgi:hypothetical protein
VICVGIVVRPYVCHTVVPEKTWEILDISAHEVESEVKLAAGEEDGPSVGGSRILAIVILLVTFFDLSVPHAQIERESSAR